MNPDKLRNIAIIAHVDHGKTTLVDELLKQSGTLTSRGETEERLMDSNELEKERGITILAKNTAINWRDHRINIVDTPGHADFGGEVERILSMVDSVLLLVDAVDGPMPQTRFVTQKAFSHGLKPIVVINKVDRDGARPDWAVDQVFDLFDRLGATDEQLDFPVIYASALKGYAMHELEKPADNMNALLDSLIEKVNPPNVDIDGPFQMQISSLDYSSYVGMIGVGRVTRGTVNRNDQVIILDREGNQRKGKVLQVLTYLGLERKEAPSASAGDIIAVSGLGNLGISDTLCDPQQVEALPPLVVDEPTISMKFQVNTSPLVGQDGKFVTSRQIRDRLMKETLHNVALKVADTENPDQFDVSGRGELHIAILVETMRREGFEFAISRPSVIVKEIDGVKHEPFEQLTVDIEEIHQGSVMESLGARKGQLENMVSDGKGRIRLDYKIPARGLFGFHTEFLSMTSGTGLSYHTFENYAPVQSQAIKTRNNGVMISTCGGKATAYTIWNLQERGRMMVSHQTEVYEGMVVGIYSRLNDIVVNVTKEKQLNNIRASGTDENIILTPPINMSLEQAMGFIEDDELVEITPNHIRTRKKFLKENERKRISREKSS